MSIEIMQNQSIECGKRKMIIKILLLIIVYIVSCFFNYSIGWNKGYNVGRQTEAEEWYLRNIEAIMKHNKRMSDE